MRWSGRRHPTSVLSDDAVVCTGKCRGGSPPSFAPGCASARIRSVWRRPRVAGEASNGAEAIEPALPTIGASPMRSVSEPTVDVMHGSLELPEEAPLTEERNAAGRLAEDVSNASANWRWSTGSTRARSPEPRWRFGGSAVHSCRILWIHLWMDTKFGLGSDGHVVVLSRSTSRTDSQGLRARAPGVQCPRSRR